jgi:S1-C subfamily serine protease
VIPARARLPPRRSLRDHRLLGRRRPRPRSRLRRRPPSRPPRPRPFPDGLDDSERRDIATFRKASNSVVNITNIGLRRDFFSFDVSEVPQGSGSGFVWDREGHVVTNFHVIEGGNRFTVSLAEDVEYEATPVGTAPDKDIAVLKIEAPPTCCASSSRCRSAGR